MTDAKKIDFWALYEKAAAEVEAEHAEKDANRGGVIAFYNRKGGVGSTTLAYHACLLARERGLSIAVASTDPTAELHRWLGLEPRAPDDEMAWDVDLAIVDVHAHTEQLPYDVDIWIVPVFNRMSFEHARDVSDQLVGEIYWLPNIQSALRERSWVLEVPEHLRGQVEILQDARAWPRGQQAQEVAQVPVRLDPVELAARQERDEEGRPRACP